MPPAQIIVQNCQNPYYDCRRRGKPLGGPDLLGRTVETELDLVRLFRSGLPPSAVDAAVGYLVLSREEVEQLIIPRHTLARRKQHGEPLTTDESDKPTRVVRVATLDEDTFQSDEKAHGGCAIQTAPSAGSVPSTSWKRKAAPGSSSKSSVASPTARSASGPCDATLDFRPSGGWRDQYMTRPPRCARFSSG